MNVETPATLKEFPIETFPFISDVKTSSKLLVFICKLSVRIWRSLWLLIIIPPAELLAVLIYEWLEPSWNISKFAFPAVFPNSAFLLSGKNIPLLNVVIPVRLKLPFNKVSPRTSNSCVGEVLLIPTLSVPSPSWIVFPNIFNIPVLFSI